jgi:hypothetical protein
MRRISLTGDPARDDSCIVLNGVGYDIGHIVKRWDHLGGFDGYTTKRIVTEKVNNKTGKVKRKVIKGPRYGKRRMMGNQVDAITQLFLHHSGADRADPGVMWNVLYNQRRLSVHFAGEDDGRIYQFNDMADCCWHAGSFNKLSVGVELTLFPLVNDRPRYYDPARNKRTGNLPHEIRVDTIHGQRLKVFVMPESQWQAIAMVYAGAWVAIGHQRTKGFEGHFDLPPQFPRNKFKTGIPMTVVPAGKKHVGLFTHFQATKRKIDPCGFPPMGQFEEAVARYYKRFRSNLSNGG